MADTIEPFNSDISSYDGYAYTGERLSCKTSNARMSRAIFDSANFKDRTVLDVGCGDGTYTWEILQKGAKSVLGIDPAAAAIECAKRKFSKGQNISFEVVDVVDLATKGRKFDIAVLRGVLHHLHDTNPMIKTVCEIAKEVVVVEPNGFNPVLKVIEKISPYHRRHEEKSYAPPELNRWFENSGASIEKSIYVGIVPIFCPDLMVKILLPFQKFIESLPVVRSICCGQYVFRARTRLE